MVSSDFRAEARRKLSGNWKKAVLATLVYMAVFFLIGLVAGLFPDSMEGVISLITTIIELPLVYGLITFFVKLYNGEDVKVFDFFSLGFSNFARAWKISLHILLKLIVPIILIIVAYIIIMAGSTMTFVGAMGSSSSIVIASSIFTIVGVILLIVSMIWAVTKSYYYQLANLVAINNPDLTAKESVMKSKELMDGKRGKLFGLQLSFIGWALLSVITFYIGYLWVLPYMQFAIIAFYKFVIGDNSNVEAEVVTENNDPIQGE